MKRSFLNIFIIFSLAEFSLAQHDNRYDPFDWIMYLQLGAITSITEGFRYFYIGTEMGGVVRVQSIGQQLDDSITQTQGLKSNEISAVHFDRQTGRLWIIAGNHVHSSHSRVGDWDVESLNYWGLPNRTKILRMGSSKYYVWVHTSSGFVKLDHISGIFLGTFPYPDEEIIQWSSSSNYPDHEPNILNEYSLSDGWLSMSNMIVNPYGSNIRQSVFYEGKTGDVVVGMEDRQRGHAGYQRQHWHADDLSAGGGVSVGEPQGLADGADCDHPLCAGTHGVFDPDGGGDFRRGEPAFGQQLDGAGPADEPGAVLTATAAGVQYLHGRVAGGVAPAGSLISTS